MNAISALPSAAPRLPEPVVATAMESPSAKTLLSASDTLPAEPAPDNPPAPANASPFTWRYADKKDEMTDQVTRVAMLPSETTYELGFPYGGGTHSILGVKHHPRHGVTVTVKIDNGQLTCHAFTQCRILVRFDDRPPIKFRGVESADHSFDVVYLEPEAKFLKELRNSTTVAIELPFFQEGLRVFHFKSANFKWD